MRKIKRAVPGWFRIRRTARSVILPSTKTGAATTCTADNATTISAGFAWAPSSTGRISTRATNLFKMRRRRRAGRLCNDMLTTIRFSLALARPRPRALSLARSLRHYAQTLCAPPPALRKPRQVSRTRVQVAGGGAQENGQDAGRRAQDLSRGAIHQGGHQPAHRGAASTAGKTWSETKERD